MISFNEFVTNQPLNEAVTDHAKTLMATGNYDPAVRGSPTKFKKDLISTGATQSQMTAQAAWANHKHLHPKTDSTKSAPKPVVKDVVAAPKPAPAKTEAPKAASSEFEDAKKVADHARKLGFRADVMHDGHGHHTVALGRDYFEHKNYEKLEDHMGDHNLQHIGLAANVYGSNAKRVY